jgi:hypothetical protein
MAQQGKLDKVQGQEANHWYLVRITSHSANDFLRNFLSRALWEKVDLDRC